MLKKLSRINKLSAFYTILIITIMITSFYMVNAEPQGATIQGSPSVDTGPTRSAGTRSDLGGRIITMNLNLEQQNTGWKAYIGNVTGNYVLQNAASKSIYEWPLGTSIGGEVYASRNDTVNFTSGAVTCASEAEIVTEEAIFGFSSSATDSINSTFNSTAHTGFDAGSGNSVSNCFSTSLWVNDAEQDQDANADFQEVVLHDQNVIVFATIINDDTAGFDNTAMDFQIMVPENKTATSGTPYYFYLELS